MPKLSQGNVTDATRRQHYQICLQLKREHEDAMAEVQKANAKAKGIHGSYRNALKEAEKAGVDKDSIAKVLAVRMEDPAEVVRQEQEFVRMLAISGVIPTIQDDLFADQEPVQLSHEERATMTMEVVYDEGVAAGLGGRDRDSNPFTAGSEEFDTWDRAYLNGQAKLAEGLGPKKRAPRAPKVQPSGNPEDAPAEEQEVF